MGKLKKRKGKVKYVVESADAPNFYWLVPKFNWVERFLHIHTGHKKELFHYGKETGWVSADTGEKLPNLSRYSDRNLTRRGSVSEELHEDQKRRASSLRSLYVEMKKKDD